MVADQRIKKKKIETLVEVTLTQKLSVMVRWVFLQLAKKNSHLRKPDQFYVTDSQMRLLNVAIAP